VQHSAASDVWIDYCHIHLLIFFIEVLFELILFVYKQLLLVNNNRFYVSINVFIRPKWNFSVTGCHMLLSDWLSRVRDFMWLQVLSLFAESSLLICSLK
jgi:hypothetical protein